MASALSTARSGFPGASLVVPTAAGRLSVRDPVHSNRIFSVSRTRLLDEYNLAVTCMLPLKFSGAAMNALSKSRPGTDQRVGLNSVPAESFVPSTKSLRTRVSPPAPSFKTIPSGIGSLMAPVEF